MGMTRSSPSCSRHHAERFTRMASIGTPHALIIANVTPIATAL
jgi:hypothetical protein